MATEYCTLCTQNIAQEHVCCAIADPKHQQGVAAKKQWLKTQMPLGHVFCKLPVNGKVFIEYAPLETAWVPIEGDNYLYIHCLWVSGSYKEKGHGAALLQQCLEDARRQGRSGVCAIAPRKKKPFHSDGKFLQKYGFVTVDTLGDGYDLMALSLDGTKPRYTDAARRMAIDAQELTLYYSPQCPYSADCRRQIETYCRSQGIPFTCIQVDTLPKAKAVPGVFNNWALFYRGQFVSTHLMNETYLKKLLAST